MLTNFSVPQPCGEDWEKMNPREKGRYCSSCQKIVTDFTSKSTQQILDYLEQHRDQKVCGTFRNQQLRQQEMPRKKHNSQVRLLSAAIMVVGVQLISCSTTEEPEKPPTVTEGNSKEPIPSPSVKDSVPPIKVEDITTTFTQTDTNGSFTTGFIAPEFTDDTIPLQDLHGIVHIEKSDTSEVVMLADKMPEFPGGTAAFLRYISSSIQYPQIAKEMAITGTVYIGFIVEMDGSIRDVRLLRGIGGGCDEEALRVIRNMPNWYPAFNKGNTVRVRYNVPIRFKLQ